MDSFTFTMYVDEDGDISGETAEGLHLSHKSGDELIYNAISTFEDGREVWGEFKVTITPVLLQTYTDDSGDIND